MDNGNNPAMPVSVAIGAAGDVVTSLDFEGSGGLTKREHFAAMAMQGLCSAFNHHGAWSHDAGCTAESAVDYADALLAALEKK